MLRILGFCLLIVAGVVRADDSPWAATQPLSKLTGLQTPDDWQTQATWQDTFQVAATGLPEFFDWRFYSFGLTPVRRQRCGDCWAQGTVGVLESLIKIKTGEDAQMSVQEVISCSGRGTCGGGYFAHQYHQNQGGTPETQYPYSGTNQRCKQGAPKYWVSKWGYVGSKNSTPTTTQIKQAILEHGPVAVTVTANGAMQSFKGEGAFKGCTNGGTNHIVVIVGWDDNVKTNRGSGVWFMRNSWGTDWGDGGYAKVPYGCSRIGEQTTWADLKVEGLHEDEGLIVPWLFR